MRLHRRARLGCIVAALILVSCGEKVQHDVSNGSSGPDVATNYQQAVLELPERQRDGVLFRAIRDAGIPCQDVTSSERVPDETMGPTWRARCEDGAFHLVSVRSDGVGIVISAPQP